MQSKILILPTYYPTKQTPIVGAQVKEQAELISDIYDVRVVYCLPGMGIKRFLFQLFFGNLIKDRGYKKIVDFTVNKNVMPFGVYFFSSKVLSENINYKLRTKAYNFVLDSIVKSGWNPELISSRGFEIGGGMALEYSKKLNIPFVHTENTAFLFDATFTLFKLKLYKKVLSSANKLMFVSGFLLKNSLMHGFVKPDNPTLIGNPIDSDCFIPTRNTNTSKKRILITGYNSYIKDFETFFKALEIARGNKKNELRAVIAITYGNNETIDEFKNLAKKHSVLDICEFKLKVSREEMPNLIRSCDMYVSTSIIETFGIALLESIFCGIPVISTRNGGSEDFINSKNGFLCDIGDYKCIASAIEIIASEEVIFHPEEIRNTVINKFGSEKYKANIERIYQDLLNKMEV